MQIVSSAGLNVDRAKPWMSTKPTLRICYVGLSLLDVKSDPSKFVDLPNWRWLDKIVPVLYQYLPHLACTLFLGSEEKLQTNQSIFIGKTT